MKSLEYVKEHISEIEKDILDTRFTKRFIDFLPTTEWEKYGYKYAGRNFLRIVGLIWETQNATIFSNMMNELNILTLKSVIYFQKLALKCVF